MRDDRRHVDNRVHGAFVADEMDVATVSADAPRRGTVEELAAHGVTAALGIFFSAGRVEMWAADATAG